MAEDLPPSAQKFAALEAATRAENEKLRLELEAMRRAVDELRAWRDEHRAATKANDEDDEW